MENSYPSYQLGGFDFLIEYDSRISCIQATQGELLTNCGWEYFTYSLPSSNSVRIVALAETNNGANHPSCFADSSGTLALLRFQLGSSSSFNNEFVSVWWHWEDCGDNSLSSFDGNELYISDSVYYFNGSTELNITQESSFPTQNGAPNECVAGTAPTPTRLVDFYSGGFSVSSTGFQVHCPSDITAPNDSSVCGAVINFDIPLNSSCAGMTAVSTPPSGSFFPLGTTVVTTVATDDLGHIDSCYFNITVEDKEPPQSICQTDTILYTYSGEWWTQLYYDFSASDFCSEVTLSSSHPSGSYFSIGVTEVTCVATDSAGNADTSLFNVTVIDNEPPIIQCPDTIIVPTDSNLCGAVVDFSVDASDNSMQVTLTTSVESGSFFPIGTTIVSAVASDPYGNSDSCSFPVIIEDREPPQIACISDIIVANDLGNCGAVVDFFITATDNCSIPVIAYSNNPGSFFPIGSTLVVVTATDESFNIDSCQFYIVVEDSEPPHITAPNDLIIPNDLNQCGAVVDYSFTATDNCDEFVVSSTFDSGTFFDVGTTLVVLQVTDNAGLIDSDSFAVIVEDRQVPSFDNILNLNVMSDSGLYGAFVEYTPNISDNCQLALVSVEPQSGSYFEIGENEVTVTALDIHGNSDSILFYVNVTLQDIDNDMVADFEDNCLSAYNPEQQDANSDGIGDACCCVGIRGNIDGGFENPPNDNGVDISDLVVLVSFMFETNTEVILSCPAEADIDANEKIDISDLVLLVSFMFENSSQAPYPCQ